MRVSSFYVFRSQRGRGTGRRALDRLRELAAAQQIGLRLDTCWSWQRTVRFYLRAGDAGAHVEARPHAPLGRAVPHSLIDVGADEATLSARSRWRGRRAGEGAPPGRRVLLDEPSREILADKSLGSAPWDAVSTLSLAIALEAWPLVRSQETCRRLEPRRRPPGGPRGQDRDLGGVGSPSPLGGRDAENPRGRDPTWKGSTTLGGRDRGHQGRSNVRAPYGVHGPVERAGASAVALAAGASCRPEGSRRGAQPIGSPRWTTQSSVGASPSRPVTIAFWSQRSASSTARGSGGSASRKPARRATARRGRVPPLERALTHRHEVGAHRVAARSVVRVGERPRAWVARGDQGPGAEYSSPLQRRRSSAAGSARPTRRSSWAALEERDVAGAAVEGVEEVAVGHRRGEVRMTHRPVVGHSE